MKNFIRFRNAKGQALVETALVLPILLLILCGIFDFGLLFNNYLVISNASREGARSAVVGTSDANILILMGSVASSVDASKLTLSISPAEALRKKGDEVTVTAQYANPLITPIISSIIPNPLNIKAKTVMRME